jgi:heme/copper-type cytochrome/quinol oxidase subunit 1
MSGRWHSEFLGYLHFAVFFVGVNMIFFPMHFLGMQGMPRRYPDYAPAFAYWNHIASVGYMVMAASIVIWLVNILYAFTGRRPQGQLLGRRAPPRWNGRCPARRPSTSSKLCRSSPIKGTTKGDARRSPFTSARNRARGLGQVLPPPAGPSQTLPVCPPNGATFSR